MIVKKRLITKAEICHLSDIINPFLYIYPNEFLEPINNAITNQGILPVGKKKYSDNSKDRLIESIKRHNETLKNVKSKKRKRQFKKRKPDSSPEII